MGAKIIISGLILMSLIGSNSRLLAINAPDNGVYICNGPNSKVYHRSNTCKGLNRCSTQITKLNLSSATAKGRRACKIEY
jgi:hypothetical protein